MGTEGGFYYLVTADGGRRGPYGRDELRALWASGEIGGRVQVVEEGSEAVVYLDQIVDEPVRQFAEGKRLSKTTKFVFSVIGALILGYTGALVWFAVYRHQQATKEIQAERKLAAAAMRTNFQILRMYQADYDGKVPTDMAYSGTAFNGYEVDGQGWTESTSEWAISSSEGTWQTDWDREANPDKVWIFMATGWQDGKVLIMTQDGQFYTAPEDQFMYATNWHRSNRIDPSEVRLTPWP